jgi:hypothetical protein
MAEPAFVSLAEFARLHGVSKPTVTGWRRRGYLVITDDKVDVAASNRRLADRPHGVVGGVPKVRPGAPGAAVPVASDADRADDPANWSRQEALRQREIAQARLAQIEADRESGLVVPIAEVCKEVAGEYAIVRAALLAMPAKLAHRLAAATTPEECGRLVDAEVRAALMALTADEGR